MGIHDVQGCVPTEKFFRLGVKFSSIEWFGIGAVTFLTNATQYWPASLGYQGTQIMRIHAC